MQSEQLLRHFAALLVQAKSDQLTAAQLCQGLRRSVNEDGGAEVIAMLPAKFGAVLEGILTRLESGSLFSEESCSFSQSELLQSLEVWIAKAGAQGS